MFGNSSLSQRLNSIVQGWSYSGNEWWYRRSDMKNPTAQISGTLTAIWVVPKGRDCQAKGTRISEEFALFLKEGLR